MACAAMDESRCHRAPGVMALFPAAKTALRTFLALTDLRILLGAPYRLIHIDLENRNILVTRKDGASAPTITGFIDWDLAFVGPAYFLFEHNEEVIDACKPDEHHADCKTLRKHYVKTLLQSCPAACADRTVVKRCFNEKCVELTKFQRLIKHLPDDDRDDYEARWMQSYLALFEPDRPSLLSHPYDDLGSIWTPDSARVISKGGSLVEAVD